MCRFALLALIAFCLLPATAVAKQPPLTFLTHSELGIAQLGTYKGFYETPRGTLHIVNVRAGTTRDVVLPQGCENRGIGGPEILLACADAPIHRIWNSWTGNTVAIDASRCSAPERVSLGWGIGRYWIAGSYQTDEPTFDDQGVRQWGQDVKLAVYINRRTGRCRVLTEHDFGGDLDRPQVPRRHYGEPDRCTRGKRFIIEYRPSRGMYVKLCAPHAHWRFSGCGDVNAGPNLVACVEGRRLLAYIPALGRRLWWRAPPGDSFPTVLGDRIYLDVIGQPDGVSIYTVDLSRVVGG
jgi:hypothetical protein